MIDSDHKVVTTKGGPNLCYGCTLVTDSDGVVIKTNDDPTKPIALCACGKTKNAPLCDGSHKG